MDQVVGLEKLNTHLIGMDPMELWLKEDTIIQQLLTSKQPLRHHHKQQLQLRLRLRLQLQLGQRIPKQSLEHSGWFHLSFSLSHR